LKYNYNQSKVKLIVMVKASDTITK